jgi:hypothetical protein
MVARERLAKDAWLEGQLAALRGQLRAYQMP